MAGTEPSVAVFLKEVEVFEKTVETSGSPHITVVECLGDLVVREGERSRVVVRTRDGAEGVALEQGGESLTLTMRADGDVTCPLDSTLTIRTVRGDLKVRGIRGSVDIGTVHGEVTLGAVGPTVLGKAYGDMSARDVAGDLEARSLLGDVWVNGVEGRLSLGQVGSDLRAEGVEGGLSVEQVGADVWLGPPFTGSVYRLRAGSDLQVRLPADASLRLVLHAGGEIRSRVPGLTLEQTEGESRGVLGAGEALLEADVGGHIYLHPLEREGVAREGAEFDFPADLEDLGLVIESRIAEAMTELEARLEESLGRVDSEAIRRRVERSARRARQAAEQARRAAEREAQRARLRAERAERRWQRATGQRPRPRREPPSDEERLRVLRLVEEGKISPEQAADLLAALEGR